jgi:hypothetical protein
VGRTFQRGWLRKEDRKAGPTWVLRYKTTREIDGKRVEHTVAVGLVKKLPSEAAAWQEVERRHLNQQINRSAAKVGAATFGDLAKSYLDHDFARLSPSTQYLHRHNIEDYLLPDGESTSPSASSHSRSSHGFRPSTTRRGLRHRRLRKSVGSCCRSTNTASVLGSSPEAMKQIQ